MIHIVRGLVFSYAFLSLFEWYIHKYQLHRLGWMNWFQPSLYHNHQIIHHPNYKEDFEVPACRETAEVGIESDVISTLKVSLPLSVLIGLFLPIEGVILLLFSVAHSYIWTAFHREMHLPQGRWFARTYPYRACLRHHTIHHENPKVNFCGLCLGADWVCGTNWRGQKSE